MKRTGVRAAIAADSHMTAQAGMRIAEDGGNAVDIAVAAALAATVSEILMCSLGGSGFFMVKLRGKDPELIEGADMNPAIDHLPATGSDAWHQVHLPYGDGVDVMAGHASIAVPGVLAAAEATWKRHGSLPWKEIVAPAIELAARKIPVSPMLGGWLATAGEPLFWRNQVSRDAFFVGSRPLETGEPFQVKGLRQTLEAIADQGADAFYRGDLGHRLVDDVREHGGFVTREALSSYRARVRKPLSMHSCGFELALNPPPAVGGAAVGFLISRMDLANGQRLTPAAEIRSQAEAQLQLLRARRHENHVCDAVHNEPADKFLAMVNSGGADPLQAPSTTHVSVATADGDMVGITMSMGYGSGVMIRDVGIACNGSLGEPELNPSELPENGARAGE